MNILADIRNVLEDHSLSIEDKIIDIERIVPKKAHSFSFSLGNILINAVQDWPEDGKIVINGGQIQYTNKPRLIDPNDIYWTGCGCTWDKDLDGNRYHKLYHPVITKNSNYKHLKLGDYIK